MNLLAFSGPGGAGKSTAASFLEADGWIRVKFAGPLKSMLRAVGFGDAEIEGHLKEVPNPLLAGKTPRHAMQTLGTEWGRDCIGPDFWVGLWERTVCDVLDHGGRVVVDDCRFDNEAACVRRLGGKVVRITGRSHLVSGHSSEALAWTPDVELPNDESVQSFEREVARIASSM